MSSKGVGMLAERLRKVGLGQRAPDTQGSGVQGLTETQSRHLNSLRQNVAAVRFFGFALAITLMFVFPTNANYPAHTAALMGAVASVSIVRVGFLRPARYKNHLFESALILVELGLVLALIMVTRGLDSPFLVYSLIPLLTASLFLELKYSVSAAVIAGLSLFIAHGLVIVDITTLPSLASRNYLGFLMLYLTSCGAVILLPYLSNINLQRRTIRLARDAERERLRQDIHDDIAQNLAFTTLKIQRLGERVEQGSSRSTADDLAIIKQAVERTYLAVRDLLDGRAEDVSGQTLGALLRAAGSQLADQIGLPVHIDEEGQEVPLDRSAKYQLFQITKEALANAGKHAKANKVDVKVHWDAQALTLDIEDDGIGLPPYLISGHGITIMKQRTASIGGEFGISTTPRKGTRVTVTYDYKRAG